MGASAHAEAAVPDTVAIAPGDPAEIRRVTGVILEGVEPQDHALRRVPPERNQEVPQHRAPGEDFRLGAPLGPERHLVDRSAVELAEDARVHGPLASPVAWRLGFEPRLTESESRAT